MVKGVWLCSNRGVHAGDFAMGHVRGVGEEQLRALFRNAGRARRRVQSAGSCGRVLVGRGSDMMERCFDGTAEGGERRVGRRGVGKMCILSKSGGTHGWVLGCGTMMQRQLAVLVSVIGAGTSHNSTQLELS